MKMLSHQKHVLQKVSGNKELFKKELIKSLAWLEKEEIEELIQWLKKNHWDTNRNEVIAVFNNYMIRDGKTFIYKKLEK